MKISLVFMRGAPIPDGVVASVFVDDTYLVCSFKMKLDGIRNLSKLAEAQLPEDNSLLCWEFEGFPSEDFEKVNLREFLRKLSKARSVSGSYHVIKRTHIQ